MYEHLGKTALCSGFYKKTKDGIFIECYDKDGGFCFESNRPIYEATAIKNGIPIKELHFEGDGIEKTLYTLVKQKFVGVCVGEKELPITEFLYSDTCYDFCGNENGFIGKEIKQTCKCYVIYYANNRKRYVPKDFCKFMEVW